LWTVAVFLFGALPIALKRGTGRIIIGDEYDTTDRREHQGIPHYNGLYDQSRYFDNALTRYYARKGWDVSQFSIVRPLSELLIEKTLVERYAELFRLQMSCHATHMDGDRARPCGQCEKCRRIVGMVTAIGGDPTLCGYTREQIEKCLAALASEGIHQEKEGAEHLAHLLAKKGILNGDRIGTARARPRPQVLQLRFDRERAPFDWIPGDLREKLFQILCEHAEGAVRRSGKLWVDVDLMSDAVLARPYPFETPSRTKESDESVTPPADRDRAFILGNLTWPEARERFKKVDVALLPVGAIEQHGPHLPLDIDSFDALHLAEQVAAACSDPKPFVLPLIPYGVSYHHDDFAGTISISNDTLARLAYDVGMAVARNGITKLIIVNGHGGNTPTLHFAAQMINRDARIFTCVDTGETSDADIAALIETPNDVHAGEYETSTALASRPELVQMHKARKNVPRFSSRYLEFSSKRSVDWYARTARLSKSGVMGDPSKASREKGEKMWAIMIRNLVELVEHIKTMSLDEIYQRNRY
jgi:creatinine amidohydrolase/Fe(II)-dependent formamide hydrolase-like protein